MCVRLVIFVLLSVSLYGCASSPLRIALMSPEELRTVDEYKLCYAYHYHSSNEKLIDEIRRRKLISETDWESVKNGRITVGMTRCGVVAILAIPYASPSKQNNGRQSVEVIGAATLPRTMYPQLSVKKRSSVVVYLVDGIVTKVDARQ